MISRDIPINRFRPQIMGIATIGVVLVHSVDVITWPVILNKIFGFGGIGVYTFVFLSAIGLFGSLSARKNMSGGYL